MIQYSKVYIPLLVLKASCVPTHDIYCIWKSFYHCCLPSAYNQHTISWFSTHTWPSIVAGSFLFWSALPPNATTAILRPSLGWKQHKRGVYHDACQQEPIREFPVCALFESVCKQSDLEQSYRGSCSPTLQGWWQERCNTDRLGATLNRLVNAYLCYSVVFTIEWIERHAWYVVRLEGEGRIWIAHQCVLRYSTIRWEQRMHACDNSRLPASHWPSYE